MATTEPSSDSIARVHVVLEEGPAERDAWGRGDVEQPDRGDPGLPILWDDAGAFPAMQWEADDEPRASGTPSALIGGVTVGVLLLLVTLFAAGRVDRPADSQASDAENRSASVIAPDNGAPPVGASGSVDEPTSADADGSESPSLGLIGDLGRGVDRAVWPGPPVDHEPHVMGRPMTEGLVVGPGHPTLIYVNDIGRPTVVDFAGGFQSELGVSDVRSHDRFLVESGRVVTDDPQVSNLPPASGRAIPIYVARSEPGATQLNGFGPHLCLDDAGCPELRWTTGVFGDGTNGIRSLEGDPVEALVAFFSSEFGAGEDVLAEVGDRWTVVDLVALNTQVRVPTPMQETTIWLLTN